MIPPALSKCGIDSNSTKRGRISNTLLDLDASCDLRPYSNSLGLDVRNRNKEPLPVNLDSPNPDRPHIQVSPYLRTQPLLRTGNTAGNNSTTSTQDLVPRIQASPTFRQCQSRTAAAPRPAPTQTPIPGIPYTYPPTLRSLLERSRDRADSLHPDEANEIIIYTSSSCWRIRGAERKLGVSGEMSDLHAANLKAAEVFFSGEYKDPGGGEELAFTLDHYEALSCESRWRDGAVTRVFVRRQK